MLPSKNRHPGNYAIGNYCRVLLSKARRLGSASAAIATVLILVSCPSPFNATRLSMLQDLIVPRITFTAPLAGSAFESTAILAGTIVDYDGNGEPRSGTMTDFIESAVYYIQDGTGEPSTITMAASGSFQFSLATADFENQITIVVAATDKNGNTGTASITLVPDSTGPFLAITSPEDYAEYATVITLSGYAANSFSNTGITEVSPTILYELPGTNISGNLTLDADGGFSTTINASALSGDHTIQITTSDLNGNTTTAIITVVKPADGGDVSGFTLTPGNKQVTISWNPVPFAESYTVFESRYGVTRTGVTSPLVWNNLENGNLYAFQLTAVLPEGSGSDAESAEVITMPLSSRTFTPWIRETGYRSITLEWRSFSTMTEYTIQRSESAEGPWAIRSKLTGNLFTDRSVEPDTAYYYRVFPSNYQLIPSDSIFAVPGRFKGEYSVNLYAAGNRQIRAYDVEIEGNYAYVASSANGFAVLDVSNPLDPRTLAIKKGALMTNAHGVAVSGNYAYVVDEGIGGKGVLAIFDISNPAILGEPACVALSSTGSATGKAVAVWGNYAFVATGGKSLVVVDISNKSNPAIAVDSIVLTSTSPTGVAVAGGYIYVADMDSGLAIIDIATIHDVSPTIIYCPTGHGIDDEYWYNDVVIVDTDTTDYAYVTAYVGGLAVINITNPALPGIPSYTTFPGLAVGVAVAGDSALVADELESRLAIFDISNPAAPGTPEFCVMSHAPHAVDMAGDFAFAAADYSGIAVVDISNAAHPATPVSRTLDYATSAVSIRGNFAFLAATYNIYLGIINFSDPANPGIPSYIATASMIPDVVSSGNFVYVANNTGLSIVDVSNPLAPGSPVYCELDAASGVAVAGDFAYVTSGASGLAIVDISDPLVPMHIAYVNTPGNALDVVIAGHYAYVADESYGLAVIDISDPDKPVLVTSLVTTGTARDIALAGDHVFIADGVSGLAVIDISNPEVPGTVVYQATAGEADGVAVSGGYAFIASNARGLSILDISNLADPQLVIDYPSWTGYAKGVTIAGRYAYVASAGISTPGVFTVIQLWESNE